MDEYTPDTLSVRAAYAVAGQTQNLYDYVEAILAGVPRFGAEFDRWLADRDKEVAARAWDESAEVTAEWMEANRYSPHNLGNIDPPTNPYRVADQNGDE